jgi:ATP-dependent protease ClpP protease subunit
MEMVSIQGESYDLRERTEEIAHTKLTYRNMMSTKTAKRDREQAWDFDLGFCPENCMR